MSVNVNPEDLTDSHNRNMLRSGSLPYKIQFIYGIGHILNDMCASMWFTYLLVYFHLVLGFGASQAGAILLIGQVADAIATPFVGFHSDLSHSSSMCSYGRRKSWHLFGTICVLCSFPFIFTPCIECQNAHKWAQLIYYSAFVVVFQIGWAAVQVSHLSLIPELTSDEHERTHLTAIRYSFTVFSNVLIYVVTWIVLHITTDSNQQIGPADAYKFQQIVAIGVGTGAFTSILFHCFLREPTPDFQNDISSLLTQSSTPTSHRSMLKSMSFYQVGVVYMGTRLFVNLSQVFTPLYLHRTLALPGVTLASIPLVMFIASFATSLVVRPINRILGRKIAYTLGGLIGICGCIWMFFGHGDSYPTYQIYAVVVIFGVGGALMLVTSLGLTADLIGNATNTAAFVYGSMSFSDKLANGLAVIFIQHLAETADSDFYRWAIPLGCGGAALLAILAILSIRLNSIIVVAEEDTLVDSTQS